MFSVQRFQLECSPALYTTVDEAGLPLPHIEEYLKYLRQTASPNTVRSYSRAITRWFNFIEPTNHTWKDFPTTFFGDFLTYLYTGRNPHQRHLGEANTHWLSPASVQRYADAVSAFYTYQEAAHGLTEPYQNLHFRSSNRRALYQRFLTGIAPNMKTTKVVYSIRSGNKHRQPILGSIDVHMTPTTDTITLNPPGREPLTVRGLDDPQAARTWLLQAATGHRVSEILMLNYNCLTPVEGAKADTPNSFVARLTYQQTKVDGVDPTPLTFSPTHAKTTKDYASEPIPPTPAYYITSPS